MNKVINQRRYDTETAKQLAYYSNGHNKNDFDFWSEGLYRTKTGNYFLHYDGGRGGGGEQIKPIGLDGAQKWGEKYLTGDEYEDIFGVIDNEQNTEESEKIFITLPKTVLSELREKRETTGATVSWLITKALRDAGYQGQ